MSMENAMLKNEQDSMSSNDYEVIITQNANNGSIRRGTLEDLKKITVLPEIIEILPPDSSSYNVLKQMISSDGAAHTPVTTAMVNEVETMIDGHRKMQVLLELNDSNIVFYIKRLNHIHTLEEAKWWIIKNCQSYRRLNKIQRIKMALQAEPVYKKLAAENKKRCGRKKENLSESDKFSPIDTLGLIAKDAQVGRQFADDVKFILNSEETTVKEKRDLDEQKRGASAIRDGIENRIKDKDKENKDNEPPVEFINPPNIYNDVILRGDNLLVLDEMAFAGVNNVVTSIFSPHYNVGLEGYGSYFSDNIPRDEYLERLAKVIYKVQILGRDGMRLCIIIPDTINKLCTNVAGDFMHNIAKDLGNMIDALNRKYDDCNLRYWGRFHCCKGNWGPTPYVGSPEAPVLKSDSDGILVWIKNQRKLICQNSTDCSPHHEFFSDGIINKYTITKEQYMEYTCQTWLIRPRSEDLNHPALCNEEICRRLILLFSNPNDGIVLDPFVGSGTTCESAKKLQRHYVGIDINPEFCNLAKKRIDAINTINNE